MECYKNNNTNCRLVFSNWFSPTLLMLLNCDNASFNNVTIFHWFLRVNVSVYLCEFSFSKLNGPKNNHIDVMYAYGVYFFLPKDNFTLVLACEFTTQTQFELFQSNSIQINKKVNPSKRITSMDIYYSQIKLLVAYKSFRLNQFLLIGHSMMIQRVGLVYSQTMTHLLYLHLDIYICVHLSLSLSLHHSLHVLSCFLPPKRTSINSTYIDIFTAPNPSDIPNNRKIQIYLFSPAPVWNGINIY